MNSYAFTVKDNVHQDVTDYTPFFDILKNHGIEVSFKYFEQDSKGRGHYHGIISTPSSIWIKGLCTTFAAMGLHTRFEKIFNIAGWLAYCRKDQ